MKSFLPFVVVAGLLGLSVVPSGMAWAADDDAGKAQGALSLGGAAPTSDDARVTLWNGGTMSAGFGPVATGTFATPSLKGLSGKTTGKGMQMGGFLAWQSGDYRIDATLAPSLDGSVVAGLGAAVGAAPGTLGTSYGVRLGGAWLGERFTVNPASGLGLAEVVAPTSDVNLTFTINHALTPSLSLIGTAEARRNISMPLEGVTGQSRLILGAGLGYRF